MYSFITDCTYNETASNWTLPATIPVSSFYKSIAGRYRPVSYPDGPITARYRFIKNASWDATSKLTEPSNVQL